MSSLTANCFSCKKIVQVEDPVKETTKNGRLRVKGKCVECKKPVSRFIADPDRPALTAEEKKEREQKRREEKKKERELSLEPAKSIKKAKKRKVRIGDVELTITAAEVTDENQPKRRKLTAKEKREKLILELKQKNEELEEELKQAYEEESSDSEEEAEPEQEKEESKESSE